MPPEAGWLCGRSHRGSGRGPTRAQPGLAEGAARGEYPARPPGRDVRLLPHREKTRRLARKGREMQTKSQVAGTSRFLRRLRTKARRLRFTTRRSILYQKAAK